MIAQRLSGCRNVFSSLKNEVALGCSCLRDAGDLKINRQRVPTVIGNRKVCGGESRIWKTLVKYRWRGQELVLPMNPKSSLL